jgi:hypothetical protein
MARPRGDSRENPCVGKACTITETEVYKLTDYYTYERNFHLGPIFTKGITESGKKELKRLADLEKGETQDCAKGCICGRDPGQKEPKWDPDEKIDIWGFGQNGVVFYCHAMRRRRRWKGHCKAA